ncbi:MAG: hypothetical protein HYU98_05815 [Deltaproteobacteria bacterium]|nr:hypothetical protein [Deltaproteobacteria bacterium]
MRYERPLEKTLADEVVVLTPALLIGLAAKTYIGGTLLGSAAKEATATFVPTIEQAATAVVGAAVVIGLNLEDSYKETILEGIWGL